MEGVDELAELEELLCSDLNEDECITNKKLNTVTEVDIFLSNSEDTTLQTQKSDKETSAVHNGDTDSSDDEENRNYTERKYNDSGIKVKKILDNKAREQNDKRLDFETRLRETNIDVKIARNAGFSNESKNTNMNDKIFCAPEVKSKIPADVYTDPVFGIRITKPLISSAALLERMQGREAITMLRVKRHIESDDANKDWVISGVIVRKSASKKSQKGNQFLIWTLSDLKDDLKTVSLFLFRKAYNDLWKTTEGTVVAVLNPNILDRSQNSNDQACLSIDSSDRVMILGQSKDFGMCKSRKKNGEPCTSFVNISQCEHCIYHVKQEYQKFSKRQELQSSTMGKGLMNLQNKVLGKSTVIYGGKAYSALPSGNNKKVKERDQNRLMSLSDYYKSEGDKLMTNKTPYGAGQIKNNSSLLHSPTTQRKSDSERLNKLSSFSPKSKPEINLADRVASSPKLGNGFGLSGSGTIDLSISYSQKKADRAKINAVKLIQQNGGIPKLDPNNIKGTEIGKKRSLEKLSICGSDENDAKKHKPNDDVNQKGRVMSERFKKILEATSIHQNLIQQHDDNEQEKYFSKLEKKEAMEEKMLNTFKLPCKAVRCAKCKYTAFSAAQRCKDERHPLKILDTFKRFFKCLDCNNRTVSLELVPLHSCKNCSSSRWEKAPMLREKKVTSLSEGLSIRGEEETFIGGQVSTGKNINLLVPDS